MHQINPYTLSSSMGVARFGSKSAEQFAGPVGSARFDAADYFPASDRWVLFALCYVRCLFLGQWSKLAFFRTGLQRAWVDNQE